MTRNIIREQKVGAILGPWTIRFWFKARERFDVQKNLVGKFTKQNRDLERTDMIHAVEEAILAFWGDELTEFEILDPRGNGIVVYTEWP